MLMQTGLRAVVVFVGLAVGAGCSGVGSPVLQAASSGTAAAARATHGCRGWRVVKSAHASSVNNQLYAVAASPSGTLWAVGGYEAQTYAPFLTLAERWDGKSWSVVTCPSPGYSYNSLGGLAVVSARDIWAPGATSNDGGNTLQTLVERWNGKQWSVVSSPNVPRTS